MYMWKAVDGENSCKTQHRTEDASVITDTDTDTAGKVKLGWRWVAKQLAGSQVTVCSLNITQDMRFAREMHGRISDELSAHVGLQ